MKKGGKEGRREARKQKGLTQREENVNGGCRREGRKERGRVGEREEWRERGR